MTTAELKRFNKTKRKMEDAFAKATLARQPRINELRKIKSDVDSEIYQMMKDILNEVLEVLKQEANQSG